MYEPKIVNLSCFRGPAGQWIYVAGQNFSTDLHTAIFFGDVACDNVTVYDSENVGCFIPSNATTDGLLKVVNDNGEDTFATPFVIGTVTDAPTIGGLSLNPDGKWGYLFGSGFVNGDTTVSYNGYTTNVVVYSENLLGYPLQSIENVNENGDVVVTTPPFIAISVTTSNGTVTYTISDFNKIPSATFGCDRIRSV
jgi:hypothetical protein